MSSKLKSRDELVQIVAELSKNGSKVGFTSGAFDLLHAGHVSYLEEARRQCDVLVVGLNSDQSIRAYKDPTRPLVPEHDRAVVVSALGCVDYVFIFDETNNNQNIKLLKPSLYLKASDYDDSKLTSKPLVESYGGKVVLLPFSPGRSTTALIKKAQEIVTDAIEAAIVTYAKAPAAFIDRDGTINEHVEYLHEPEKFQIIPGALEGIKKLEEAGYRIIVLTNQPGIGMGYFTKEDFFRVNREMLKAARHEGVLFDRVYFCPHTDADRCQCRKPNGGMVARAVRELNVDLKKSVVIGDMTLDVQLAKNVGCASVLVKTGRAGQDKTYPIAPDFIANDLCGAADWVVSKLGRAAERASNTLEPSAATSPIIEEIVRTRSLEAVGRVAGKLGHDFNNLFGSIRGCADLMRSKIENLHPGQNPVLRQLNIIDNSINRAVELTTKLRGYVRPGPIDKAIVGLRPCVELLARSIRDSVAEHPSIEVVTTAEPHVEINEFLIMQMLTSLCLNSIEAMQKISDRHIIFYLDQVEHVQEIPDIKAGSYARLSIMDHGVGVSETNRAKLLEPFFTTSPGGIGKGMGLSLSMAREIMRKHDGALQVNSLANCGTIVHLYFPVAAPTI